MQYCKLVCNMQGKESMKKIEKALTKKKLFFLGILIVLLAQIPIFILGTDAIVTYHDQLDGEIIAYIYRAKYLFSGQDTIPEFLNGALKTTLTPPAPLAVLLFCVLPPFPAYVVMQLLGQIVAYAGMFLMVDLLTENKYISVIVALLYTFLPFLPVYGWSQYGVPLLMVCFYYLWRKKYKLLSLTYVAFYTAMSSLVLCGFVWIIFLSIGLVYLLLTGKLKQHLEIVSTFAIMLGIYLLTNISLLAQILGVGKGFVSHKIEYTLGGGRFFDYFLTYLRYNGDHSTDYHEWILVLTTAVLLGALASFLWGNYSGFGGPKALQEREFKGEGLNGNGFSSEGLQHKVVKRKETAVKKWSEESRRRSKLLAADAALILVLCLAAALWNCDLGVTVRSHMGTLGSFQFVRILWIAPTLWYAALALCLSILWDIRARVRWLGYMASLAVLGIVSLQCLRGSTLKMCMQEILLPDYETISWSDYLALGVMNQVEDYIFEQEGLEIEEYKVASIGIDPSAALYHGFYCVDGYSNNYDIEYKHAFRQIIAPELEKNDWLREYYDGWGNRCYLFSAEIPGYFNIEKGTSWFNNLQLDTKVLKELGCDYILSAVYIVNAEEINLRLLREEAFETSESYYRVYIYKIDV